MITWVNEKDLNLHPVIKAVFLVGRAVLQSLEIYLSNLEYRVGNYEPITSVVKQAAISYGQENVNLLTLQEKIDAYKKGCVWYTTEKAVDDYIAGRKRKIY